MNTYMVESTIGHRSPTRLTTSPRPNGSQIFASLLKIPLLDVITFSCGTATLIVETVTEQAKGKNAKNKNFSS